MKKILIITLCALIAVLTLTACGSSKKQCKGCGKTEDEVELTLLDPNKPEGKDNPYYCDVCRRVAIAETPVPGVAEEIEKVI
jgi:hypothetical protein